MNPLRTNASRKKFYSGYQRRRIRRSDGLQTRARHLSGRRPCYGTAEKEKASLWDFCCYTSQNTDVIGSEAYFDDMIEKGAKFAWFFTYMPIGVDAVPELMVSAQQRAFMYERIRSFRKTKPIFTLDFWNDGEFVQGCIAGGRRYLHINANGDIEPCAFMHYSDSSIYEKSLLEALQSPLFMQYRKNQPFNQNHLRPCPLLDNPGALAKMVDRSEAKSTDMQNPEDVHDLSAKCEHAAHEWEPQADAIWEQSQKKKKEQSIA
jgi:hypothetical protein